MTPSAARLILVVALLSAAPALHAQGRPLRVTGVRGIAFGTVFPGVQTAVPPSDAARSGRFDITGPKLSTVQITLTLPNRLTGPAGASMPLSFGVTDGGYSLTGSTTALVPFDPRLPFSAVLSSNGAASVFLGGTLLPPGPQPGGSYVGTLTITVAQLSL